MLQGLLYSAASAPWPPWPLTGVLFYAFGSATFPTTVPTLLAQSVPKHRRGRVSWQSNRAREKGASGYAGRCHCHSAAGCHGCKFAELSLLRREHPQRMLLELECTMGALARFPLWEVERGSNNRCSYG